MLLGTDELRTLSIDRESALLEGYQLIQRRIFLPQCIMLMVFVLLPSSVLWAEELISDSTSPDGKFAISYEPSPSKIASRTPQVWFINLRTHQHVCVQLAPCDEAIYRKKRIRGVEAYVFRNEITGPSASNRQMLWEVVVEGIEDQREGQGSAVNTSVTWSHHSQHVAVRVNEHKFTHTSVFRLYGGRFHRVKDYNE